MAIGLGLALLSGCGEKTEKAAKEMKEGAQETVRETMESAAAWTRDKMDAYPSDMQKQLKNLDTQAEKLSVKAESLDDDAKEAFQEQLAAITEKKDAVAMKIKDLQGASGEAWEKAKQEVDELMTELAERYENTKRDLSES